MQSMGSWVAEPHQNHYGAACCNSNSRIPEVCPHPAYLDGFVSCAILKDADGIHPEESDSEV